MLKKIIKFIYLKYKFRKKLIFPFSANIGKNSNFEGANKLYSYSAFSGYLGFGSYVGPNSKIYGKIGRYCSIGPNVSVNPGIHTYLSPFVSTSPVFTSLKRQNGYSYTNIQRYNEMRYADAQKSFHIIIDHDCWIGEGAFIAGGISIGTGAVVYAHSVVTKDIPPYAIVGGVPAKILSYRYDQDTIDFLLNSEWWNYDKNWFLENIELMSDIEKFKIQITTQNK